jgi:DNA-binding transcriptional LysR family regulator
VGRGRLVALKAAPSRVSVRAATPPDLNDLFLFTQLVVHGGFSAASHILGVSKSRLSRRIAGLEEHLGSRLVQRSTRTFAVTATGQLFLDHCLRVVAEAEAAEAAVLQLHSKPRGVVCVSCSITMAQTVLGHTLPRFLMDNPDVKVRVVSTSRAVIEQGVDIALFIHKAPLEDSGLVVRTIGISHQVLVASPRLFEQVPLPTTPEDLKRCPMLSVGREAGRDTWALTNSDGVRATVMIEPRLELESLLILKEAALNGLGVVRMPKVVCLNELRTGALEIVLPQWSLAPHEIHAVYPSRKGMTPAVRSLVEFLTRSIQQMLNEV